LVFVVGQIDAKLDHILGWDHPQGIPQIELELSPLDQEEGGVLQGDRGPPPEGIITAGVGSFIPPLLDSPYLHPSSLYNLKHDRVCHLEVITGLPVFGLTVSKKSSCCTWYRGDVNLISKLRTSDTFLPCLGKGPTYTPRVALGLNFVMELPEAKELFNAYTGQPHV
jgi:hypothetical protein